MTPVGVEEVRTINLCAGWETQVFIEAQSTPSLRTLNMSMARLGTGFHPEDENALACQVVFESLGRSEPVRSQFAREKITSMLQDKQENPWLAILAAYALLRIQEQAPSIDEANAVASQLQRALEFLTIIADHPDVRALNLLKDQPSESFWYPPLLRAGLKRVQDHATRYVATIPLESLTDVVLDNLTTNSPWTAWRHLDRTPQPANTTPPTTTRTAKQSVTRPYVDTSSPSFTYFGQFIDPAATTLDVLSESPEQPPSATPAPTKSIQPRNTPPATRSVLHQASMVQVTQSLSQVDNLDTLQETVEINPALRLTELLSNITAQEVSAATGLPLARTEQTLTDLHQSDDAEGAQEVLDSPLTPTERAIIEYALHTVNRPASAPAPSYDVRSALESAPADAPTPAADTAPIATAPIATSQPGVVEESVTKLRTEADRLAIATGDNHYVAETHTLGNRLYHVANRLLQQADFSVRTDLQGHLQQFNPAFSALLAPTTAATIDESRSRQECLVTQRAWEAALIAVPSGRSTLAHPVPHQPFPSWDIHRTAILDGRTQEVQAYLYVFRSTDAPKLAPNVFEQVKSLLPGLALYAPLCAYDVAKSGNDYLQKLESIIQQLEQISAVVPP